MIGENLAMLIKDMFKKKIDRNIQGVIVVGEEGLQDEKSELEEYVVTKELQRHFDEFFSIYKTGIQGKTRKNGVWISGFFGSGKSHFLKILSYLLGNKLVENKHTLDYFKDDHKINNALTIADMELAASVPTDVILFNIDSKSEQSSKHSKDAIVNVFLKVFNEMQGYYGSKPNVAELERNLVEDNKYAEFQNAFLEISGHPWLEYRYRFNYEFTQVAKALAKIGYQGLTEETALILCKNIMQNPHQISIEDFAKMVKKYCDKKGNNHHVVFCVDEVGQYISDDSQMMLNLQTMREELGKECLGRAWVIVTSQQDVDALTSAIVKVGDFSKIQGRFDTRLSLSSANVDEVIKKRILEKTEAANQTLRLLYDEKDVSIKNKIRFENTAEMKLYENRDDFAAVYPFVPYQFILLGKVLNSIRTHGASGKHLSEGERSMLALFKRAAVDVKDKEDGAIVPFYMFYNALANFLDAVHSRVISQAMDNKRINPDGDSDCFAVNVLKTLFLVKYVKEFQNTTVANITSLMVSNLDEDIHALTKKVEEALNILKRETLIQEHSGNYVFLTEEEQEIGREIARQNVEVGEIQNKISDLIFNDIYPESRYKKPEFNGRYTFLYNQLVDDRPHKANQNYDVGVHVLTSRFTDYDERTLKLMSGEGKQVIVVLPPDNDSYWNEIAQCLKIEKYLQHNPTSSNDRYAAIKEAKIREFNERNVNAREYLVDCLKNAQIYVNGNIAELKTKDVSARINEALGKLIDVVYFKLKYIDTAMNADNMRSLLKNNSSTVLNLGSAAIPNKNAIDDVKKYIDSNTVAHNKISLKTIKDYFAKAPYGFINDDIEWIMAKLLKDGSISLFLMHESITLVNKSADEIVDYLTKKNYVDKVMLEPKKQIEKKKIDLVKDLLKEVFNENTLTTDSEQLMADFQKFSNGYLNTLKNYNRDYYSKGIYPGQQVVDKGINLFTAIANINDLLEFYNYITKNEDELIEFADDYEPVKKFFAGEQKKIFDDAAAKYKIFINSKSYIDDSELEEIAEQIIQILQHNNPYSLIQKLPGLTEAFNRKYLLLLDKHTDPVTAAVLENKNQLLQALEGKSFKDQYLIKIAKIFNDFLKEMKAADDIMVLRSFMDKSDLEKQKLLKEIDSLSLKEMSANTSAETAKAGNVIKPKQNQSYYIREIVHATSWRLENEEDVDRYVEQLRKNLKQALSEDAVINIKF